jgi:S-adenosyl-L-methionine hydrolase (adenosine-forming)
MRPPRIITLLTDFGLSDPYVGVMKGVIAQVNPAVQVIDLTHQIPPQDVSQARFALMSAYAYFPAGTVHVAVVDPGVGGTRRAIALAFGNNAAAPLGFLVGPDNGLFSGVLAVQPAIAAVELTNSAYWHQPMPSQTFHGRDIFAPVGAHLASGIPLTALGQEISGRSLVPLSQSHPLQIESAGDQGQRITGCVQAIDHFGNVITTISGEAVIAPGWSVIVGDRAIPSGFTYGAAGSGDLIAVVGSHGWVEIAVNGGSARACLGLSLGDSVQVIVPK